MLHRSFTNMVNDRGMTVSETVGICVVRVYIIVSNPGASVGVIRRTSKRSSVGMTEDVYRSLKFKHRFSELSKAKQQKRPFVTDLSHT